MRPEVDLNIGSAGIAEKKKLFKIQKPSIRESVQKAITKKILATDKD